MNDEEMIDGVAYLWIRNGGDYIGFQWCYQKIIDRIKELEGVINEEM